MYYFILLFYFYLNTQTYIYEQQRADANKQRLRLFCPDQHDNTPSVLSLVPGHTSIPSTWSHLHP